MAVVRVWRATYDQKHPITRLKQRHGSCHNFDNQLLVCERFVCVVAFPCKIKLLLIIFHYRKSAAVGVA